MKLLILAVLLLFFQSPPKPKVPAEWIRLRDEFVTATVEYKQGLTKLRPFYEQDVVKAEEGLAEYKTALSRGTASQDDVQAKEHALKVAKDKVAEVDSQITTADTQIKEALDDAKLEADYRQAVAERRKARRPPCTRWTITSYYRETSRRVEGSFRFTCIK